MQVTYDLKAFKLFNDSLDSLNDLNKLILTLNAHSYNVSRRDEKFSIALRNCDILLPDGIGIVWAKRFLEGIKLRKIAGADLFAWEMKRINELRGTCFFLGSSDSTLHKISENVKREFPNVTVFTHSPPYKAEFTDQENEAMLDIINALKPDVLFIGMTAPKQEIWAYKFRNRIEAKHICCIGAVFDFYAGNVKRAPKWIIELGLEWLYRLLSEPGRLWRRYVIGNFVFISEILKEKLKVSNGK
jgi:N-acetylglucosaminyldiphosphoundecaprenol N-acetyl-beta-D-mannosaminyltransferase